MENLPLKFPLCISEKGVSSFKSLPKLLNSIHAGLYIEPVIIFYFSGVFQLQDWDILYTDWLDDKMPWLLGIAWNNLPRRVPYKLDLAVVSYRMGN